MCYLAGVRDLIQESIPFGSVQSRRTPLLEGARRRSHHACQGAGKYSDHLAAVGAEPDLVADPDGGRRRLEPVDAWILEDPLNFERLRVDDGDVRGFLRCLVVAMPGGEDHRAVA